MNKTFQRIVLGLLITFLLLEIGNGKAFAPTNDPDDEENSIEVYLTDNQSFSLLSSLYAYQIDEIQQDGIPFHKITIPDYGILPEPGKPELPTERFLLVLPASSQITEVILVNSSYQLLEGYTIYPNQPPLPEDGSDEEREFMINETFYASDIFYPSEVITVSEPMTYYGATVIQVELHPIQFNPYLSQLRVYNDLEITLGFQPLKGAKHKLPWTLETPTKSGIVNPDNLPQWYTFSHTTTNTHRFSAPLANLTDINNTADYLIITYDNFYFSALPLAEWKQMEGFETKIVNLTQIYAEFPGTGNTAITNFITYTYNNWTGSPGYITLVGDVDYLPTNYGLGGCATDLHYSTLSGSDFLPDVLLGRLSVHTPGELDIIVEKLLGYEKTPYLNQTAWYKNVTVFYGTERIAWLNTANWIQLLMGTNGYHVNKWNEYEGNTARMASEINGGLCFMNYREHGGKTGWAMGGAGGFYNSDVQGLTNGRMLPTVFSTTCNTGWFDDTGADCFGEVWMKKQNGGAVAFLGSSRVSYTGYNDELAQGFYKAMFNDDISDFSGIMNQGKLYMYNQYGGGYTTELQFEMYNAFTDPALTIWRDVPREITVVHPSFVFPGSNTVTVTVEKDDGSPLEGVSVTLWKHQEVFNSSVTDATGNVSFSVHPQTFGNISVTVSGENVIPYVGVIPISHPFTAPVSQGWNLLTIPVDYSWTAESLGTYIDGCTLIARFDAATQSFTIHIVGTPWDDFVIQDGVGYFVYVMDNTSFDLPGFIIPSAMVHLYPDWNLIGWFHEYPSTAESVGQNITDCSIISRFNSTSQTFEIHVVGTPWENFSIERGTGLCVFTGTESWWQGNG